MKYVIGFKSGHVIQVDVEDGQKLIKDYVETLQVLSDRTMVFYCFMHKSLINLSDVSYIYPAEEVICLR